MERKLSLVKNVPGLLICSLSIAGFFLFAYAFYADVMRSSSGGLGPPLAKLERTLERVRRKPPATYVWDRVSAGQTLHHRDSLQTGPGASAAIQFNDGSVLEVGEDSLVILDKSASFDEALLKGSVIARGRGGDRRLVRNRTGAVEQEQILLRLSTPTEKATVSIGALTERVRFVWENPTNHLPKQGAFVLEVSNNSSFLVSDRIPVKNGKTELELSRAPGKYFWRILDGNAVITETRQFQVALSTLPKLVSPHSKSLLRTFGDGMSVRFQWATMSGQAESDKELDDLVLEVSKEENFSSLLLKEEVSVASGSATLTLPVGKHYWRLVGQAANSKIISRAVPFTVSKSAQLNLSLRSPNDTSLHFLGEPLRFVWDSEAQQLTHRVIVEEDNFAESTSARALLWTPLRAGRKTWKVEALTPEGVVAGVSERKVILVVDKPEISTELPLPESVLTTWKAAERTPLFQWKEAAADASSYRLEIAPDATFEKIIWRAETEETAIEAGKGKLPLGDYYWRVVAFEEKRLVAASRAQRFQLSPPPLLNAPTVASSPGPIIFNPVLEETPLELQWSKVEEASRYELTFHKIDGKKDKKVSSEIVSDTRLRVGNLGPGLYRWSVRAIDPLKRQGKASLPSEFEIQFGARLIAPEVEGEIVD